MGTREWPQVAPTSQFTGILSTKIQNSNELYSLEGKRISDIMEINRKDK